MFNQLFNSLKNYNDVLNVYIYSINEIFIFEMVVFYIKLSIIVVESKINDMVRYYIVRFDGDVFEIICFINVEN